MLIGMLTFHRAYNYGAVLQCYALNHTINQLGADCEVIDYYPRYFYNLYHLLPDKKGIKSVGKKSIHILLKSLIDLRCANFEKFIEDNIKLSNNKFEIIDSRVNFSDYDMFITGSDQIWSTKAAQYDPVFFLYNSIFDNSPKYSYAASFGTDSIDDKYTDSIKERINDYKSISVREESAVRLVASITEKQAIISCDPVFLLDQDAWNSVIDKKKIIEGDYIFLYYVKQPSQIRQYAKKLSERTGYRVVCVSCCFSNNFKSNYIYLSGLADRMDGFITYNAGSPAEFVSLIANAKYVLTSSFHGTAFSIIFHKEFLVQCNWSNGDLNTRIDYLLRTLNLQNRTLEQNKTRITDSIDWGSVDEKIQIMRKNGMDYLREIISLPNME